MDYQFISQLHVGQKATKVKVRLSRIWDSTNPSLDDMLMSVDFIIIDEMADTLQGTIRSEDVAQFKPLLKEGCVCIIANFVVAPMKKHFRVVPSAFMVKLTKATTVKVIDESVSPIPMHKFFFIDFEDIPNRTYNDVFLTDAIGHILSISQTQEVIVKGRPVQKKTFKIEDMREKQMLVTFWGNLVQCFEDNISLSKTEPAIVTLTAMTVRTFMGETYLSSTSATKYYVDLDIPKVHQLKQWYANITLTFTIKTHLLPIITYNFPHASDLKILESSTIPSTKEDFNDKKITIYQLLCLKMEQSQNAKFTCTATIVDIDASEGWWYKSCSKCNSGITRFESGFWCDRCNKLEEKPVPWYKLTIIVKDSIASTNFIIFGKLLYNLIGVPASILAEDPNNDRFVIPSLIETLRGQTFNFQIILERHDFRRRNEAVRVIKIFKDTSNPNTTSKGTESHGTSSKDLVETNKGKLMYAEEETKLVSKKRLLEQPTGITFKKIKEEKEALEKE